MCLAIPSRIVEIGDLLAVVDSAGERREVSLVLLDEPVQVGDYVLVQNGRFAYEKLDAARAHEALALIDEVLAGDARGEAPDVRRWG